MMVTVSTPVVLTILLTVGAEVLLRIATLTKARITRLSVTMYMFWVCCILGYVTAAVTDSDPVVRTNLGYRTLCLIFYPTALCCQIAVLWNRLRIIDVQKKLQNWQLYTLLGVSAAVALMADLARFVGNLILGGVMAGSLASFPPIVSTSVLYFCIVNLCLYALTLRFMRSFKFSSHAKKIYAVVAIIVALDLGDLIITAQGDFINGYQLQPLMCMLKMRLELEIWDDFVRHSGRQSSSEQTSGGKSVQTAKPGVTAVTATSHMEKQ
ncbi:hypothetical protein RI367_000951 [Sorochytrium milnesiophthora]